MSLTKKGNLDTDPQRGDEVRRHGRMPYEDEAGRGGDVSTGQGTPNMASEPREAR